MPAIHFDLTAIVQKLGDDLFLEEALLFPEICSLGDDAARLHRVVKNLVIRTIVDLPPAQQHCRRLPGVASAGFVEVTLKPTIRAAVWQEAITLRLPVVRWSHPAPSQATVDNARPKRKSAEDASRAPAKIEAFLAFVPSLGIEVVAATEEALEETLVNHVRATLMRIKFAGSLERLVWLDRCRQIEIAHLEIDVECKTPKHLAREQEERRDHPEPVLSQVGVDLANEPLRPAYELDAVIERLVETLTGPEPRSVLLVGPSGVGKTAAVHDMVRRRAKLGLAATPFWATTGARLVAGMSGFGMWQERAAKLWREASHKRAVLHLGNLLELMEVGKSEHQSQGIASFLRPYLGRGDLLTIAECTPEQLPLIERQEAHLLAVFVQIAVPEPTRDQGLAILTNYASAFQPPASLIAHDGLEKLDLLHRRYATYSAYPGRPLRFLQNVLTDRAPAAETAGPLAAGDVTREFSRETGLPMCLLDDAEPLDLPATRTWFAQRVIGQHEPVDLVVDLLATVKAGLTRPRKPIASLLFIGPTGVGKTEMAKALAEFLFGSKDRLTRFDMSEYADPESISRLVGGSVQGEGHLTARIREQPFSVLLLDEIEKAHPQLFDLLLQVLGEGRLTDAAGRVADFCNAVVIMTSNLGAENFQQGDFGIIKPEASSDRSRQHFLHAVQEFFRPELFNRIDRVVPFAPLDEPTILGIAHRQLDLIRQRDGIRFRGVGLELEPDVAGWLARKGFDVRYGARPLKRAIDRELLAPLAEKLNGYHADTPIHAHLSVEAERLDANVKAVAGDGPSTQADAEVVRGGLDLRRGLQKLFRSSAALEMDNEIHRLSLIERRVRRGKHVSPDDLRRMQDLVAWREIRAGFERLFADVCDLEDRVMLALLENMASPDAVESTLKAVRTDWEKWLLALYVKRFERPDHVTLAVFSEAPSLLLLLGEAYVRIAEASDGKADVWQFLPSKQGRTKDKPAALVRRIVLDSDGLFGAAKNLAMRVWNPEKKELAKAEQIARPMEGVVGLMLEIGATAALPRFLGEAGLHRMRTSQASDACLVDTSPQGWRDYQPPPDMDRKGTIGSQERRRTYDLVNGILEDAQLPGKLYTTTETLATVLASALEQCLAKNVEKILNE